MLAWIDHDDPGFGREVLGRLSALPGATVQHYYTGEAPAGEADRQHRRNRISDAWRWFLAEASAPVILTAEDDTLPDADAYLRLIEHVRAGAVFAQGTEVARQLAYVPHWTVTEDEARSASFDGREVVPIQGGGWYCAAMVTEAARGCLVHTDLPLGPDVTFVRELARKGPCVGDWRIECAHVGQDFFLHPAMVDLVQVRYWREDGRWLRAEHTARAYRQACAKNEEGLLRAKVLKPFTGTMDERRMYANPSDGLIHAGTIMEMSEERFAELGIRPNPLVVALNGGAAPGSSLSAWAPPNTKPLVPTQSSVLATDEAVREYLAPDAPAVTEPQAELPERPEPRRRK